MNALQVDALVEFIKSQNEDESFEYLAMSHLKMSALYWSLTALFLLKGPDALLYSPMTREEILEFLQSCRNDDGGYGGDVGYDSHLLFTLSALQVYKLLAVQPAQKERIESFILGLAREDGSFQGDAFGEVDTRFSYCALVSLHLLEFDFRTEDGAALLERSLKFVEQCRNWDGGFGAVPGAESHAGQIFCCQALLSLFQRKSNMDERLTEWLSRRQVKESGGLNGRPQKLEDVCYSWWVLSALANLGKLDAIDQRALEEFILRSQELEGPIADRPGDMGDIFHSFFGVAGLALLQRLPGTESVDPIFCLPCE